MASNPTYSASLEGQTLATCATAVVPSQWERLSSRMGVATTLGRKFTPPTVDHARNPIVQTLSDTILRNRLIADVAIGLSVTAVTTPVLTAIDRAIVQRAAGTHTVAGSLQETARQLLRHPSQFLTSPAVGWVYAAVAATYVTANVLDTLTDHTLTVSGDEEGNGGATKTAILLVGTTTANTTTSLLRDRAYSRMFGGATSTATCIPLAAYGFWLARDATVISSSFILPRVVGSFLELSSFPFRVDPAVLQIATPTLAQVVAGPLHWAGLEVAAAASNAVVAAGVRGGNTASTAMLSWQTAQTVGSIITLRMARILPGYGITGCANTSLRQWYKEHEQHFVTRHPPQ